MALNGSKKSVAIYFSLLGLGVGWVLLLLGAWVPNNPLPIPKTDVSSAKAGALPTTATAKTPQKTYQRALPGYRWQFPKDHASHPSFKTEWWYYTGHLQNPATAKQKARHFGYQFTVFRSGSGLLNLPTHSAWSVPDLLIGHLALTDVETGAFYYDERFGRPGGLVGHASTETLDVSLRNWTIQLHPLNTTHTLSAKAKNGAFTLHLTLSPETLPILHGKEPGLSQKANCAGCASHYYSYPRMQTTGSVQVGNTPPVTVTGTSWMDHEFGSNQLTNEQTGWDWFSVTLNTGESLMLYQLRNTNGLPDANSSGTWVSATGQATHLPLTAFSIKVLKHWQSPSTQALYPAGWQVEVPSKGFKAIVTPKVANQELQLKSNTGVTYWEGASTVDAQLGKQRVGGNAYVELTGYSERFKQQL